MFTDNRPAIIRTSCDESLQRLGVDHLDLFYLHRMTPQVPVAESVGAMGDLVKAGKVRYVGVSEISGAALRRAHAEFPIAALQSELSPWTRSASEESLQVCRELGIAFVAYSPLGRGFLTGAIRTSADLVTGDSRHIFPRFQKENLQGNQGIVRRLEELAKSVGCTPAQLSLAWVLAQWEGVLPIPGTKQRRFLEDNAGAMDIELSPEQLAGVLEAVNEDQVLGERYPQSTMASLNV